MTDNAPRSKAGRAISTSGLIGLGICFFLPQVRSCNSDIIPAHDILESPESAVLFLPFLFAFAMLAVYLVRALAKSEKVRRALSHVVPAFALVALLVANIAWYQPVTESLSRTPSWDSADGWGWFLCIIGLALLLVAATLAVVVVWCKWPAPLRIPGCVLVSSVVSTAWFAIFIGDAEYGLYLSLASCALTFAGTLVELLSLRRGAAPP